MEFKKIASLFQHTHGLLKKYNAIQRRPSRDYYRIVDVIDTNAHAPLICFQIIGKATIIKIQPKELVANDHLLEGFSKKDIRTLTYLACEQLNKPLFYIVAQEFNLGFNHILFKLKKRYSTESISKTASQITLDESLIHQLSPEDRQSISYTAGYEHALHRPLDTPVTSSQTD